MIAKHLTFPYDAIAAYCRRHHIRRLAVFGSALRADFRPSSDIDLLVEFEEDARRGLFALGRMQMELSELLGREVDLKTIGFLSPRIRQRVLDEAEAIYEA